MNEKQVNKKSGTLPIPFVRKEKDGSPFPMNLQRKVMTIDKRPPSTDIVHINSHSQIISCWLVPTRSNEHAFIIAAFRLQESWGTHNLILLVWIQAPFLETTKLKGIKDLAFLSAFQSLSSGLIPPSSCYAGWLWNVRNRAV